ncbi:MAG TPA: hypothetical protein VKS01_00260 [Bryobacteraceae bacterium]|nr:hypothetical protein [Bryobacteraceae bacterium]
MSTLALAMAAVPAFAAHTIEAASEPAYNLATTTKVDGVVTAVRQVAAGNPMPGVHLTVKTRTNTVDVYLAPADFLKFLRVNMSAGAQIEAIGSLVKVNNAEVLMTRDFDDGFVQISLRDAKGAAAWQNWGQEIDPALVQ